MNSSLQIFSNNEFSARTIEDDGQVWFVGKDIAEALEYSEASNPARLFDSVPECWRGVKRIHITSDKPTARPYQEMLCLTEQGLYFFLGRSDKPKALPYQIWIANDVVPSIRKTGSYSLNKTHYSFEIDAAARIFELAGITGNQLTLALDKVYKSYTGHSALEAAGIELIAPEKQQLLTPTEIGQHFNLSARRVNEILAGAGFQHKINGKWEPIGDGLNYAVMLDTNKKNSEGTPVRQLKWHTKILNFKRLWEDAA